MIELKVNGQAYAGWKRVRVIRSIEAMAGAFELMVSDRWGSQDKAWPIREEDECTLSLDGETMITGYVDRRRMSVDAGNKDILVGGRDKTGALVDCSAVLTNWEYTGAQLFDFARKICRPFEIDVVFSVRAGDKALPALPKLVLSPGESAYDAIEKACRLRGVLAYSNAAGQLVLAQPGITRAQSALKYGVNVLAAQAEFDASARYRKYIALAQVPHTKDDIDDEAVAVSVRGEATDPNVRRASRVLMVRADTEATWGYVKRRAQWEATVRAARSDTVSVVVQGWRQGPNLPLWAVNTLVDVDVPFIEVSGTMLITEAVYTRDESGTTTSLTLRRPDAFVAEPNVPTDVGTWKRDASGIIR